MFNMNEIGRKIAMLRKEKNLTQVELADKLGISYQAVSNWERGDSMPDISKLADLSEIFDVSIDELLGNERKAEIVKKIINEEKVEYNTLSNEELKELLPIVKPKQFEESFSNYDSLSFEQLLIMAPFLDEEVLDEIVRKKFINNEGLKWVALAPFISDSLVNELFIKEANSSDRKYLIALAPFADEEYVNQALHIRYEKGGIKDIVGLLPFASTEDIKKIYQIEVEKGAFKSLAILMPFL